MYVKSVTSKCLKAKMHSHTQQMFSFNESMTFTMIANKPNCVYKMSYFFNILKPPKLFQHKIFRMDFHQLCNGFSCNEACIPIGRW